MRRVLSLAAAGALLVVGGAAWAAPGEKATGEKLNLWLKLSGDLKPSLVAGEHELRLSGKGVSLLYDQFYAHDARGKKLGARMALSGKELRLEVDDTGAVYPITIDPTLAQEAKLTASDAAAGDLFGISVAIDGDTAVVSARNDDTAAGVNTGSVMCSCGAGRAGLSSRSSPRATRLQVTPSAPKWL